LKSLSLVADKVFQLNELKGRELATWIKDFAAANKYKISAAAVNLLADYVGGDLWLLAGELNKLMTYCGGREITDKDVRDITNFAREDSIFVLVDSILEGKIKDAQVMLHRMLTYGTAPQQILAMIERQLSIVLRVKELSHDIPLPEIKSRLGLHPRYPLDKTLKQARSFTIPRLRKAFHCLLETDVAIKTGKYEDDLALDLMVIELCKN
jgi:DNA polymerase III subunit delta